MEPFNASSIHSAISAAMNAVEASRIPHYVFATEHGYRITYNERTIPPAQSYYRFAFDGPCGLFLYQPDRGTHVLFASISEAARAA